MSEQKPDNAASVGSWLHKNKWFTNEPVSYLGYQALRSTLAAIPYGFGMASVHHAFGALARIAEKAGFNNDALKTKGLVAIDQSTQFYKPGISGMAGRALARVATSPLNAAVQIGVSFTMFRFVGGIVKTIRDKITDKNNTEAQTIEEIRNIPNTIKETAKKNWPAESASTPWAALTLGYIGANFKQSEQYHRLDLAAGQKEGYVQAFKRVWSPKAKLFQNAAIWTISYSAFFEVAERLFKDVQLRHGTWSGHSNSLLKKKDDVVGHSPQPTADAQNEQKKNEQAIDRPWFAKFTEDPSLGRLLFRRVIPVALGITSYAVVKRALYVVGGGQMMPITDEIMKSGASGHGKTFLTNVWREGFATSGFFALWSFTDPLGTWYDKYFGQKMLDHKAARAPQIALQKSSSIAELPSQQEITPSMIEPVAEQTVHQAPKPKISHAVVNQGMLQTASEKALASV